MAYKISKTLLKVLIVAAEVIVAGAIAYVADDPRLLIIAPALEFLLDWLKHRNQ